MVSSRSSSGTLKVPSQGWGQNGSSVAPLTSELSKENDAQFGFRFEMYIDVIDDVENLESALLSAFYGP